MHLESGVWTVQIVRIGKKNWNHMTQLKLQWSGFKKFSHVLIIISCIEYQCKPLRLGNKVFEGRC